MSTIQEVAQRAGVSAGTVSRYLNGYKLKAANEKRVAEAIDELGYRSNYLARSLRSNRSMSIGLLINNMLNHFATSVVAQVEREMEINDYNIILSGFREDREVYVRKLENLIDRRVDGLVLFEAIDDERGRKLIEQSGIPTISVSNPLPYPQVDNMLAANRKSCRMVTRRMIDAGHTRIGVLAATQREYVSRERLAGVLEAFDDAGLARDNAVVRIGDYDRESGYRDMMALVLEDKVDTVFALNYGRGQGAQQALAELGVRIGEDISFACYDYLDTKTYFHPSITTVCPPSLEIGTMAAREILAMINEDRLGSGKTTYTDEDIAWLPSIIGL
ncbi:MAG: LacI family DNA-binding transcriptional regulator [Coriobacteriaceae bacterium]|nr:LacI family DNA-binding transcriptional regulator [Coriobacteriaceae bacterium]